MRAPRRTAAGWLAASLALLAGCAGASKPAGVDGDITNGWPAMAAAKTAVPAVGMCFQVDHQAEWTGDFSGVKDCTRSHTIEVVHVGAYEGSDAQRGSPPLAGSDSQANAYAKCQAGANAYLGGDWHSGLITLDLSQPDGDAWKGGARWYMCDVTRYTDDFAVKDMPADSVKGALGSAGKITISCRVVASDSGGSITSDRGADCGTAHNAEYVGVYAAPAGTYPADATARRNLAGKGCDVVVAKFLGFSDGKLGNSYIGDMYDLFDQDRWNLGDRTVRCYALGFKNGSPNNARFTGSVKGIRTAVPKWA
jgi:hypothetical protein